MIEKLFKKEKSVLTYGTVTSSNRHIRTAEIKTAGGVSMRIEYPAEYDRIELGDGVVLAGKTLKNIILVSKNAGPQSSILII